MAGYCKSLLGNFKGQNPDRFYFDVMKTHNEVVDKVWSILHPNSVQSNDENSSTVTHTGSSPNLGVRNDLSLSRQRTQSLTSESNIPPPLPPIRNLHRSHHMHRSNSIQDADIHSRPPSQRFPPLPPYTQRSASSDILGRGLSSRRHNLPTHGPHMASTASFNPYLSPSISENGTDTEDESVYASGGSDCYVSMSTRSDPSYIFSTQSDPGSHMILPDLANTSQRDQTRQSTMTTHNAHNAHSVPIGAQSDTYITSGDSDISTGSIRINSPPPIYSEVDLEHSMPPVAGGMHLVSPIIPVASDSESGAVFNFDANAVLTRTRELEGELQRLRTAMTCRLCKQNPIGATFCPCGHTVCCHSCAQRLRTCWECNETVSSVQRMLLTRV